MNLVEAESDRTELKWRHREHFGRIFVRTIHRCAVQIASLGVYNQFLASVAINSVIQHNEIVSVCGFRSPMFAGTRSETED